MVNLVQTSSHYQIHQSNRILMTEKFPVKPVSSLYACTTPLESADQRYTLPCYE